jgi:hypothetical protein
MSTGNYDALFKAYKDPPKMCGYIEDHFVGRERIRALNVMAKAWVHCCLPIGSTVKHVILQL